MEIDLRGPKNAEYRIADGAKCFTTNSEADWTGGNFTLQHQEVVAAVSL